MAHKYRLRVHTLCTENRCIERIQQFRLVDMYTKKANRTRSASITGWAPPDERMGEHALRLVAISHYAITILHI